MNSFSFYLAKASFANFWADAIEAFVFTIFLVFIIAFYIFVKKSL
ncbi:hypothetical protein BGAFAR04_F0002 (plasmid) [Borreliella garinii Far04]|nr:hypothetical protein BGAFAR04_F0002 [Borreliella garinii Far04]